MTVWRIREDREGLWAVTRDRQRVWDFSGNRQEVVSYVRSRMSRKDKVVMEEADGYRVPFSLRRGWRR